MIKYLSVEQLIKMNVIQIKTYSPAEPIIVNDRGALEMAVNLVQSTVFGEEAYPTIHEKAALLMIQLIKKHPFGNANKRTGLMAAIVFLKINGYTLKLETNEAVDLVIGIATFSGEFDSLKERTANKIKESIIKVY